MNLFQQFSNRLNTRYLILGLVIWWLVMLLVYSIFTLRVNRLKSRGLICFLILPLNLGQTNAQEITRFYYFPSFWESARLSFAPVHQPHRPLNR
jgi:hypothetical protein